ncbi:alginate export family protein [Methyloprofundus sedimenti]|uniref:hypothetical protein n=1 Tax=Methyloprofundus sedimenti TaxID=1420851 RepID=UPI00117E920C|nr:hypothetical protein [Methyloprofundus sedimenti]
MVVSSCVFADYEIVKGKYGKLAAILNINTAAFAEANPWFGKAQDNIGDTANFWWEFSTEAGLKASVNFFGDTELYGAYSFIYAQTVGHDASGLSFGYDNPGFGYTEKAYAGWRSGTLFPTLGKNAIDISGGRQNYQIGSGFLIYTGATNGGIEGAYWIGPRTAFKETVIGRINSGPTKIEVFHLVFDAAKEFNEAGSTNGVNLEFTLTSKNTFGFTYLHIYNTDNKIIDGLDVFDGRVDITPLPFWPQFTLNAEYAFEQKGSEFQSNGGFAKISYEFKNTRWTPTVSFRFAGLQGDNPDTVRDEGFTPLTYGMSEWGTWFQGEIIGEYVLANSNLFSYLVSLSAKPTKTLGMHLFYYHFNIDQSESLADNVTAHNFADEVDLIADWQVLDSLSLSAVLAMAIPGEAARQYTGGGQTWFHSMLYASWSL